MSADAEVEATQPVTPQGVCPTLGREEDKHSEGGERERERERCEGVGREEERCKRERDNERVRGERNVGSQERE